MLPEGESPSYRVVSPVEVLLTDKDAKSQLTCQVKHSTLKSPLQEVFSLGEVLRGRAAGGV